MLAVILWPHATGIEPPVRIASAGFQLILLTREHGRIIPAGRPFWQIIRDPLGR